MKFISETELDMLFLGNWMQMAIEKHNASLELVFLCVCVFFDYRDKRQ